MRWSALSSLESRSDATWRWMWQIGSLARIYSTRLIVIQCLRVVHTVQWEYWDGISRLLKRMQRSTYLNVLKSQHVIRLHVQRFVVETIALQYWLPRFVFHFALYVQDDHITFRHCSVDDSEWDITSIKVTGLTSHSNDNKSEMGRTVNLATSATITVGSAITHSRLWPLILVLYYNKFHSIEYGTKTKIMMCWLLLYDES